MECLSVSRNKSKQSDADKECHQILENFIFQRGDMGAKLLSILSAYINQCHYKICPLNREDQQEILQEVSIKLLHRYKQLKGSCNGWLFIIVRNEYIDHLRRNKSRSRLVEPDAEGNLIEVDSVQSQQINSLSQQAVLNETDCLESVFDYIESQPTGQMDISIYTGYAEGLSLAEIADLTGRTVSAIGKRISNLRKRVRQLREDLC